MSKSIFCILKNKNEAKNAIEQLREASISNVSILCKAQEGQDQRQDQRSQAGQDSSQSPRQDQKRSQNSQDSQSPRQDQKRSQAGQESQIPGLSTINVPGIGNISCSGQFQNWLKKSSGTNPLQNALTQLGIADNQATKLLEKIKSNSILCVIQADSTSDIERAREILEECGAADIAMSAEKVGAGKKPQQW